MHKYLTSPEGQREARWMAIATVFMMAALAHVAYLVLPAPVLDATILSHMVKGANQALLSSVAAPICAIIAMMFMKKAQSPVPSRDPL